MKAATATRRVPSGACSQLTSPFSASPRNESSPLTTSAPTTAPERLPMPPTTSIARVRNVSSR